MLTLEKKSVLATQSEVIPPLEGAFEQFYGEQIQVPQSLLREQLGHAGNQKSLVAIHLAAGS